MDGSTEARHFRFVKHGPSKYLFSVLIILLATQVHFLIYPWIAPAIYLLYYPAIMIATVYGNGITSVILSTLAAEYFFSEPKGTFFLDWPNDYLRSLLFFTSSLFISRIIHREILTGIRYATLAKDLELEKKLREQFVLTLSHDLRNPISAAHASAQLYLRNPDRVDVMKLMQRVMSATERADRMIRDLLDASIIRAGQKLKMEFSACNLQQIAADVIEEKSLQLNGEHPIDLKSDQNLEGYWNSEGLRRILENLIDNALKYGDPKRPITVKMFQDQDIANIVVHNFGHPLNEEEKQKIFEAFGRTQLVQQSGQQGWGLGLTLVRGIAEAHQGVVNVESGELGTSFIVRLPRDARKEKLIAA